jgi:hypothetical protein
MYRHALAGYEHTLGLEYYLTQDAARALNETFRGSGRMEEAEAIKERYKRSVNVGLDVICDISERTLALAEYYHHL